MKKKVLILTLGALCVSQLWNSDNASAIVTGEANVYKSSSLNVGGYVSSSEQAKRYLDSLDDLIYYNSVNRHAGYEEPEYKEVYDKYQKKFLAEIDAVNKFRQEQKKVDNYNRNNYSYGLTYERYINVYNSLKANREEFDKEVKKIEDKYEDLTRFYEIKQEQVNQEMNKLENQILMIGQAFIKTNRKAVLDMYNRLDMVVGTTEQERQNMLPTNERMRKIKIEDLETIIDEFFNDIGEKRPENIPALTNDEHKNKEMVTKLKSDTEAAKKDVSKRSKRSLDKQNHSSLSEEVSEEQKVKYNKEMEEIKEKFLAKSKFTNPVVSLIDDEDDNGKDKQLIISTPTNKPVAPPTYTETTTQVPMPAVERQTQQQIIYNAPKQLAGLNGESHDFKITHQSPETSNYTYNNLVEFEEASVVPDNRAGSLVGFSQTDSSHLTEREKRVIKREHVREAQKLVDNYKDTHSYNDRVKAQQKVNTLSAGHQKRFNKQINKVYSGQ
ncbi:von Willebrand factor binding protein Vwb [Staphylococcus aureus]|uniref:von Willebrand factor binding protein Vwb n=1 Tax=Staphylococcus aureus TaxID=1280 RepID=UPI000DE4082B|nr:von Willebrand factor binding protein Vwb [Staphylococcus aureus]